MSRSIITKTILLICSIYAVLFLTTCAAIAPPSGGPDDVTPPKFISSSPESGSTQFKGGKVKLLFSEYLEEKSVSGSIIVSPVTNPAVEVKYEDDEVHLIFPTNLLKDQTYIVSINRNLKDERKVALEQTIQIAFSTGDLIEEGNISGRIFGDEKYVAHLWKINESFNDSILLSRPLYVSEADDDGFFSFNFLSKGNYSIIAVERSASGLPVVPSRMLYGTSPKKTYFLESNGTVKSIPLMTKRETQPLKLSFVEWKGARWGWIHFNQALTSAVFENATLTDSYSKILKPKIFPDIENKAKFLLMLDDTLSEGKVELKIDVIKSKSFVNESANINFRYSLKPDTLNLLLEDPSPVSTINMDNNFGPRVPFIFSRPITSTDDYAFQLIADSDTVDLNVDWINPISFSFIPNNGWQEKTNYRINIFGKKLTPIEGKSFKDSITYVDVSSQKKIGYGALMGTLDEFPESMLIELKQTSDEAKSFFSNVNSNNEFYIKNLPEGKYQLILIEDLDKNNVFTYGTIQPFKRSEWFYVHPDTFEVRANWDIDVGQISMEGN